MWISNKKFICNALKFWIHPVLSSYSNTALAKSPVVLFIYSSNENIRLQNKNKKYFLRQKCWKCMRNFRRLHLLTWFT